MAHQNETPSTHASVAVPPQPNLAYPLKFVMANNLPKRIKRRKFVVRDLISASETALFIGQPNTGKTFIGGELAGAVSAGTPFLGHETMQGAVVYVAAESPESVKVRIQAYKQHHQVELPNLMIVEEPISLFAHDSDVERIIRQVQSLEADIGEKVSLIIIDTLACVTAGANENSSQDMGPVVARVDNIRKACDSACVVIHHTGKDAAAGARGWSGLRAAFDAEFEVKNLPAEGKWVEVTKVRDFGSKGRKLGFRLEPIRMEVQDSNELVTSCVVLPTGAPKMPIPEKRVTTVADAVLQYLRDHKEALTRSDLVQALSTNHTRSGLYDAIKFLIDTDAVEVVEKTVRIVQQQTH